MDNRRGLYVPRNGVGGLTMRAPFITRLSLSSLIWAAFYLPPANPQDVVGSRVYGPPPTRTVVGGTFTVGHGGYYGGYAYRPYYGGYGSPWYGGLYRYRPSYFGYGDYGPW